MNLHGKEKAAGESTKSTSSLIALLFAGGHAFTVSWAGKGKTVVIEKDSLALALKKVDS